MLDTMTMTKAVSGLCGAFLIFLFGNWAAESLYHVGAAGHGDGHGDGHSEEISQAYIIEVPEAGSDGGGDGAVEEPEVDFAALVAEADIESGAKVYNKCKSCHKEPGANGTGPTLHGVVGRDIASIDGFGYTGALTDLPGNWEAAALNLFLEAPKTYAPGTKMNVAIRKLDDRADLVAYLQSLTN